MRRVLILSLLLRACLYPMTNFRYIVNISLLSLHHRTLLAYLEDWDTRYIGTSAAADHLDLPCQMTDYTNPSTPELVPSAQRCLPRFFTGDLFILGNL
jgi:hypothetical protein